MNLRKLASCISLIISFSIFIMMILIFLDIIDNTLVQSNNSTINLQIITQKNDDLLNKNYNNFNELNETLQYLYTYQNINNNTNNYSIDYDNMDMNLEDI